MKRNSWYAALVGVAAALVASSAAADGPSGDAGGGVCTSKEANDSLLICPGGNQQFTPKSNQPKAIGLGSVAPLSNTVKKPNINPNQDVSSIRDQRRNGVAPRVRALLINEIQQLESLFKVTSKNAADRVTLARRLAETYVELENSAISDATRAQIAKNGAEQAKQQRIADSARGSAIRYYTLIANDYKATYPQLDEVYYYLAFEYEQGKNLDQARKVYFQLINETPQSKYIPNAYLAFGELFYGEAQTDSSKYELARQSYEKVLQYPPPDNKVWGYAQYKIGYVYWNMGDQTLPKALNAFTEVIKFGDRYNSLPGAKALQQSARKDIIPVYTLTGKPEASYGFFKPLSGDSGTDNAKTFDMMDNLGLNYIDTGHYQDAITLYKDLLNRDRSDNSCKYQSHILQATLALKGGSNKAAVVGAMNDQLQYYKQFKAGGHTDQSKHECANATAEVLTETSMAWHLEAVGSPGSGTRGTGDKKTMGLAAQGYDLVVNNFSKEEFATFEFPRIVKEDWPTLFKIKYAQADLLYFNQDWEHCGPAFDRVVDENPQGPEAPEAAYAAVLCYQKQYDAQHQGNKGREGAGYGPGQSHRNAAAEEAVARANLMKKNMSDSQKGMVGAFNRYVCYVKPADNDQKAKDQYVEVKYARARTYFEAHYWEQAAVGFKDIALNYSDSDSGIYAAQLYLESLNIIGSNSDPPRPSCFDEMSDSVSKIVSLYCEGGKASKNPDQCNQLTKIQCDIQRLKADNTVKLAQKGGPNALRQYEDAGNTYLNLWKKYGEGPMNNRQPAQCDHMDEIVFDAAESYQSARLVMRSIQARLILLKPDYGMDKSDLARRSTYKIGGNYQAIAVYDQAAEWYERYAKNFPASDKADAALSDAVVLRLGLGQDEVAIKDSEYFMKAYGGRKPAEAARVAFAIGAHYVEREDWAQAKKRLNSAMGTIDKNATLDVKVQAHALLGRTYIRVKADNSAHAEYKRVQDMWRDPKASADSITNGDADNGVRRLGKALTAVGEAYFYFAEREKKKVDAIKFPDYKGPADKASVLKHIQTKVKDWIGKKAPAIQNAEKEYLKIVQLQPDPPPRWVIAAGSRVGGMWGRFVDEFRAAPIPNEIKRDTELRGIYYDSLDSASEPQKQRAKAAFETCLKYSVTYQYFDEFSRACEVWLSKTYKNEYHQVDEFRGAPNRVNSGLSDRPYPLDSQSVPVNPNPPPPPPPDEKSEVVNSGQSSGAPPPKGGKGGGKRGGRGRR